MIWSAQFSDNIITAVECKWFEKEHALQWRTARGDAAVTLLGVLSTSFRIIKCYSFNIFCSFNSASLLQCVFPSVQVHAAFLWWLVADLVLGECVAVSWVQRGSAISCVGLSDRNCSPGIGQQRSQFQVSLLGCGLKGMGEVQRECVGNHEMFLENLENRLI